MCFLPRQDQPGSPHQTGPPRPGRSASSDRGRPASLISDPAAASPAPASRALACPAAAFQVLASQVAAFQAPSPCVSPPHDVPTFFPPCHHGLRVSLAPVIRDTAAVALLPGLLLLRADPSLHLSRESAKPIPPVPTDGGMRIRPCRTRGWMGGDGNRAGEGLPGATRNLGEGSDQSEGGEAQRGRGSPSVLSRDSWVVGVRPRKWAAPAGPRTRQPSAPGPPRSRCGRRRP